MIENRFLHFLTQEAFNRKRSEIPNNSIVFIDKGAFDKPEIWTHGKCYSNTEDIYDLENKVEANPSDAASAVLNKIKIANTVYSIGSGQGPVTYGSLVTDNEEGLQPSSGETFDGTIKLNRIAKTGSYKHLVDLPTGEFTNFLAFDDDHGFMDSGYNSTSFQARLTPGYGINIENNVISTTGNQGGGDSVAWDQIQNSGTKIASITINGDSTDVYAPNGGGSSTGSTVTITPLFDSGTEIADYTIDGVGGTLFAPTPVDIIANPSSSADLTLSKIQIGNDVYNVNGAGAVTSVNDKIGDVILDATDVGAIKKPDSANNGTIAIFTPTRDVVSSGKTINQLQLKLDNQTAYEGIGSTTEIPVITTNSLGQVTSLTTATIDFSAYATTSALLTLQLKVDELSAQLVGFTVNVSPDSIFVGKQNLIQISVNVSGSVDADSITISRNGTVINTQIDPINPYQFVDRYTPQSAGKVIYKVNVSKSSLDKSSTVSIDAIEDEYRGTTWSNYSISDSSLETGESADITKGVVTANYLSGSQDVTNEASFVLCNSSGTVITNGTAGSIVYDNTTGKYIYTAPNTAGTYYIKVKYNNVMSGEKITVTVTEPVTPKKHLFTASGTDYNNLQPSDWTDRGEFVDGMQITISNAANEYIFIRTDETDNITSVKVNAHVPASAQPVTIDGPYSAENGYHYYRTHRMYTTAFENGLIYGIYK